MTTMAPFAEKSSIEDYLGPSEKRFFGSGFRRVNYRAKDVEVTSHEDGGVLLRSTLGVEYPEDWSKKGGRSLRPHFSTIDALVLGAEMAELCIARSHGFNTVDLRRTWIRKAHINAGSKPLEDLNRIEATATRREQPKTTSLEISDVSVIDCMLGTMRVQLELVHPRADTRPGQWRHENRSDLFGPPKNRYYGDGFKSRAQRITDVRVEDNGLAAQALLQVVAESPWGHSPYGLEADYQPSASMVDCFVAALQLAQIILYKLDGMRREDSETLWMRRTTMTAELPYRICAEEGVPIAISLDNPSHVRMANAVWRTADITGNFSGVNLRSSVTHRLQTVA